MTSTARTRRLEVGTTSLHDVHKVVRAFGGRITSETSTPGAVGYTTIEMEGLDEWIARKPDGIEGITILVEPDPAVETRLEEFEIRQQVDDEDEPTDKLDLELHHGPCGVHLCDVEHDDTLRVLLSVARSHTCPHPDTLAYEASEDAGLAEDEEG